MKSEEHSLDEQRPTSRCPYSVICILGWVATLLCIAFCICSWTFESDLWFFAVLLFAGWAVLPIVLVGFVAFVMSWWQKHRMWKRLRLLGCLAIVALVVSSFSPHDRDIANFMASNYQKHSQEMEDLISYTEAACDSSCFLILEWEHGRLSSSTYACRDSYTTNEALFSETGITPQELEVIHRKVKQCRCIGIILDKRQRYSEFPWSDCPHANLMFQRRGFALYSYTLFTPCPDTASLRELADDQQRLRYNDSVYFLFEGGAIGSQCWDNDYLEKKEQQFRNHATN